MNTIRQLSQYALEVLKDSYPAHEIQSICHIIYQDVFHFTNIDIHLRKNEILDESFVNKFYEIIALLKSGQPLQYIIGETEFAGLKFRVGPSTLIPRPETAELVAWAGKEIHAGQRILDIGTGSGCIAITLAFLHPGAQFTALDISEAALRTAAENAARNRVDIHFLKRNILQFENYTWDNYDLIVSNPPYVMEKEKKSMESRVLDYEPHQALFVPDHDPLLFYRRIAEFGLQTLSPEGKLYFEINEALGQEMIGLLSAFNYRDIELRKDIYGKDRMLKAKVPLKKQISMNPEKALNTIVGICSKKEYCSWDIRNKLIQWEIPGTEIPRIMDFLFKYKFIDDRRFAQAYAEDKFRFNHWGKQKIALMLRQKHISQDIITEALSSLSQDHYEESCLTLLRQKQQSLQNYDTYQQKIRLTRFGLGRGFDYEMLNRCITRLFKEAEE